MKKAFTLVELIIVITILAVLATIAFVSFSSYTASSRDTKRIVTIESIAKGLNIFQTQTGKYPNVDNQSSTGIINSDTLSFVGEVGDNVSRLINISPTPKDPVSGNNFKYGTSFDNKYFQVAGTQEKTVAEKSIINQSYANSRQAKVLGNYNGLLKKENKLYNLPSLLYTGSGYLISNETYFIVDKGQNIPYKISSTDPDNSVQTSVILSQLTGTSSVTLTGVTLPSTPGELKANIDSIVQILGYPGDKIGQETFGTQYFVNNGGNSGSACKITQEKINKFGELCLKYDNSFTNKEDCINSLNFDSVTGEISQFPVYLLQNATQQELVAFNIFKRINSPVYFDLMNNIKDFNLPCLEYAEQFWVYNNPVLESINVPNIDTNSIWVYSNPMLKELIIAKNLKIMLHLWIYDNPELVTIDGFNLLEDLTDRGAFWIYDNQKLENLPNFDNLKRVSGLLMMYQMNALSKLPTFPSLVEIYLDVNGRADIDLSNLPNITNDKLSVFDGLSIRNLNLSGTTPADCTQLYITVTGTCSN